MRQELRSVEIITAKNIALVEYLVLRDSRLKGKEISEMSKLSDAVVRRILHDHLEIKNMGSKTSFIYSALSS